MAFKSFIQLDIFLLIHQFVCTIWLYKKMLPAMSVAKSDREDKDKRGQHPFSIFSVCRCA